MPSVLPRALACVAALTLLTTSVSAADDAPTVFEKRLKPIYDSPSPSSCAQCHLAGVDLKNYLLPDHEKTFRSLRDQGLINLDKPGESKILALIEMGAGEKGGRAAAGDKARTAEREAFAAWIEACAGDQKLRATPPLPAGERAKGPAAEEVVRHARVDRVLDSFERNVWAMRFRCMNCHTEGTPQNDKHVKEYGEKVAWVKKAGAKATMEYLIASKLIDVTDPEKSLLLKKPLGQVKHEGGVKFAPGDLGHKAFRTWVEDVAAIRGGRYANAADLPAKETGPLRFGTDAWLKLTDTPAGWADRLIQVSVYAYDQKANSWEAEPVAVSDRVVWGKGKLWQHNLTLLAAPGSERAKAWAAASPRLPKGKYLVKVYVDAGGRLAKDWKQTLGPDDYAGEVEIDAAWAEGYGKMSAVSAAQVRR